MPVFCTRVSRERTVMETATVYVEADNAVAALEVITCLYEDGGIDDGWRDEDGAGTISEQGTFDAEEIPDVGPTCSHDWSDGDDPHAKYDICNNCGLIRAHAETAPS